MANPLVDISGIIRRDRWKQKRGGVRTLELHPRPGRPRDLSEGDRGEVT